MTPLWLFVAALAIGIPAALSLLLWAACALAGRVDQSINQSIGGKMNIINLTPHAINIYAAQRLVRTVEPSGTVARVAVERQLVAVDEQGIEFYTTAYGEPVNLPEPQPDTIYIVSGLLRNAVLDRVDLWQPGELLRNEAGQPIGCIGLQQ